MHRLTYKRLLSESDRDIAAICAEMDYPDVARFLNYDKEHYWSYVTTSTNVYYYKVYCNERLIGSIHLEIENSTMYMSILVFKNDRNQGLGKRIIDDLLSGEIPIQYERIEVFVDSTNCASVRLFEQCGFVCHSVDDGLLNYVFVMS